MQNLNNIDLNSTVSKL